MPSRDIVKRLKAGERLLLDGATGSELQRRGFDVNKGAVAESIGVWSAPANLEAPDLVRAIHEDYLRLGADIVTSNNFYSSRSMMRIIGEEGRWEEYTRRGVELAVEARDAVNPGAYVAGGFAPSFKLGTGSELRKELGETARLLAETGVDFLLPEYFGGDTERDPLEDCRTALDACAGTGLPTLLGVCWVRDDGKMHYGQSFADLAKALGGRRVDGVLLMCSAPGEVSASLPNLRKAFDCPVGAYAEAGHAENPRFGASPDEQFFRIEPYVTPEEYAGFAREWKKTGAQIIGGCCATTPEYIGAIRPVVKD